MDHEKDTCLQSESSSKKAEPCLTSAANVCIKGLKFFAALFLSHTQILTGFQNKKWLNSDQLFCSVAISLDRSHPNMAF